MREFATTGSYKGTGVVHTKISAKFARFLLVGLLATLLQYCILIAGVEACGLSPAFSSGFGFVVSAALNYILNYRFTFQSSRPHWSAAYRFIVVAGIGLLLNVGLMQLTTGRFGIRYMLAQVIVSIIVLIWNFCGNAFWSFVTPTSRRSHPAPKDISP